MAGRASKFKGIVDSEDPFNFDLIRFPPSADLSRASTYSFPSSVLSELSATNLLPADGERT